MLSIEENINIVYLQDDAKLLAQAVLAGSSGKQQGFINLFKTNSWETLMTFTRESAREC